MRGAVVWAGSSMAHTLAPLASSATRVELVPCEHAWLVEATVAVCGSRAHGRGGARARGRCAHVLRARPACGVARPWRGARKGGGSAAQAVSAPSTAGRARSLRADDPHSAALQACRSLSRSAESPSRAASRVYRAAWCRPASPEAPAGGGGPWRGVLWARTPPPGLRLCIPSRAQAAIQAVFLASVVMVLGGSGAMRSGDDRAAAVASA
ncbi:hypothetical protein FB451DRAFT_1377593 [Mycena latifolia]|nr:hypothetical protein FB451DRAFT_1377593 [Mycena latifolia]